MFPLQENPSILVIHKLLCTLSTLDEEMCVEPKETHNRQTTAWNMCTTFNPTTGPTLKGKLYV